MLEKNDIAGAAKKVSDYYNEVPGGIRSIEAEKTGLLSLGGDKIVKKCTYKLLEIDVYEYVMLEGTELETGEKHLVLLNRGCGKSTTSQQSYEV